MSRSRPRPALVIIVVSLALFLAQSSRADRIVLRGGGQIRGKVLADPKHPDRVTVIGDRGKTPLTFQKAQVVEVVAEPSVLDEYVERRQGAATTAEAQYDLGLWCETHKLQDLAEVHFQNAITADPGFAAARQKLGFVKFGDRWLKGDDLREAQGLVLDRGKWISREEKDQRDKDRGAVAEQASVARRLRLLRDALLYGSDDRRREAETQLLEIRDAAAVGPLVKVLGNDNEAMRKLLARALGKIPGPESARALVHVFLAEADSEVRDETVDQLADRKEPEITTTLNRALRAGSPEVVNRAAWALGRINAVSSVPALVGALVSNRQQTVMGPSTGMAEGSAITTSFGMGPAPTGPYGTPIAWNGSSIAYLNSVSVAPGAVAFGASSVPFYPVPNPLSMLPGGGSQFGVSGNAGASTGIPAGGGLSASRGPVPQQVTVSIQNVEVRNALVKLTGEDFGYNVAAWRKWLRTSFQPDPAPQRKVPQP